MCYLVDDPGLAFYYFEAFEPMEYFGAFDYFEPSEVVVDFDSIE